LGKGLAEGTDVDRRDLLARADLLKLDGQCEATVPPGVSELIKKRGFFGYAKSRLA
jgi:hypothetical protein